MMNMQVYLEKQKFQNIPNQEVIEIYEYGVQFLRQDFKIIANKKSQVKIPKYKLEIAENVIDYLNEKINSFSEYTSLNNFSALIYIYI